jgi:hypothetical protein
MPRRRASWRDGTPDGRRSPRTCCAEPGSDPWLYELGCAEALAGSADALTHLERCIELPVALAALGFAPSCFAVAGSEFTDWTATGGTVATGTLVGSPVMLTGWQLPPLPDSYRRRPAAGRCRGGPADHDDRAPACTRDDRRRL